MNLAKLPSFVDIHEDVSKALNENIPIVALESTIITHGMPFPENAEMASSVEALIREHGVVPATIAVINPFSGEAPLAMARAIDKGRATIATVNPATKSHLSV